MLRLGCCVQPPYQNFRLRAWVYDIQGLSAQQPAGDYTSELLTLTISCTWHCTYPPFPWATRLQSPTKDISW